VLRGDDVLLPCDQRSNLARAVWLLNGSEVPGTGQERLRVGVDGLLVTNTLPGHSGEYRCYGEERGLRTLLAAYSLTVLPQLPRATTTTTSGPIAASQASGDTKVVYVSAIVVLVVLCAVLYRPALRVLPGEAQGEVRAGGAAGCESRAADGVGQLPAQSPRRGG